MKLAQIGGAGGARQPSLAEAPPGGSCRSRDRGGRRPDRPRRRVAQAAEANGNRFVSPVVARIASEHNVDPSQISGTGRGGRVTKKDILEFIEQGGQPEPPAAPAPPAPGPAPAAAPAAPQPQAAPTPPKPPAPPVAPAEVQPGEEVEPVSAMRRGIAEHMRRSLDNLRAARCIERMFELTPAASS